MKLPLVSIIITTRNEERNIERCIKSITKQSYSKLELIVVDNNSSDNTQRIAKKFTDCVFNKGPERSAQRNFGAKKAKGEYILFIDADMELTRYVVEESVECAENSKNLGGIFIPEFSVGQNFFEKAKAFERMLYNKQGDSITDATRFFPAEVFKFIGGYDELITGPEDWDLTQTLKNKEYSLKRIKALIYHYEYIPSLTAVLKKKYYYGLRAHRYIAKQNISATSPQTIYFLRPIFYKNWREYFQHPLLFLGMVLILTGELFAGGLGFVVGKFKQI